MIIIPSANCDHLIDMLRNYLSDCKVIGYVKMHGSKCANIIKKCYVYFEDLKRDIGDNK